MASPPPLFCFVVSSKLAQLEINYLGLLLSHSKIWDPVISSNSWAVQGVLANSSRAPWLLTIHLHINIMFAAALWFGWSSKENPSSGVFQFCSDPTGVSSSQFLILNFFVNFPNFRKSSLFYARNKSSKLFGWKNNKICPKKQTTGSK